MPRIGHPILEFRGTAPDFPPQRFCFQQVPDGMIWLFFLEAQRCPAAALEIAGINLVSYGQRLRRQPQFVRANRRAEEYRAAQRNRRKVENVANSQHHATIPLLRIQALPNEFKLFHQRSKTKYLAFPPSPLICYSRRRNETCRKRCATSHRRK